MLAASSADVAVAITLREEGEKGWAEGGPAEGCEEEGGEGDRAL